jgi:hypothetical protein
VGAGMELGVGIGDGSAALCVGSGVPLGSETGGAEGNRVAGIPGGIDGFARSRGELGGLGAGTVA